MSCPRKESSTLPLRPAGKGLTAGGCPLWHFQQLGKFFLDSGSEWFVGLSIKYMSLSVGMRYAMCDLCPPCWKWTCALNSQTSHHHCSLPAFHSVGNNWATEQLRALSLPT